MATKSELMDKTVAELKQILRTRGIRGKFKSPKSEIADAIVADQRSAGSGGHTSKLVQDHTKPETPVTKAQFQLSSVLTKPSARQGDRTTTSIKVSCGAASGDFPVIGKTVGAVSEFLREVLNVDSLAEGIVNGEKVQGSYVLQPSDELEFIKPAGRKGV